MPGTILKAFCILTNLIPVTILQYRYYFPHFTEHQDWRHPSVIPALGGLTQEDRCNFMGRPDYITRLCLKKRKLKQTEELTLVCSPQLVAMGAKN